MATRNFSFSIDEYYHLYNRGVDKRDIFLDDEDRKRFVKLLFIANGSTPFVFRDLPIGLPYVAFERGDMLVAIGAYCLMTNHFHILVKETMERGTTKFLNKVLTSYSSYFNKKYGRSGRLFQGTFCARHVDSDEYLKYLFAYIHLNPVKIIDPKWKESGIRDYKKAKEYLARYQYSSYLEYLGVKRQEVAILNKGSFPEYFSDKRDFRSFIGDWLAFSSTDFT